MMNLKPTPQEAAAGQRLADAVAELIAAAAEATAQRAVQLMRDTMTPPEPSPATGPERILLNVREAAAALGVSKGTLFNLTAPRGPLRAFKVGTLVRYSPEDLRSGIEQFRIRTSGD